MSNYIVNEVDIFFLMLFSEADRVGIMDHNWYKEHLKSKLELINFNHFAEPDAHIPMEEPKKERPMTDLDELDLLNQYLERACDLLNRRKWQKFKYTKSRAFNCYIRTYTYKEAPKHYLDDLRKMSDFQLKSIKNVGPHTFDVLRMARDLANRDIEQADADSPYTQNDIRKWSQGVIDKYKEEKKNDASAEETEEG